MKMMKRLFYFLLCALLFSGCAKGKWPDQVKMSSYNVVFDAGESSQRIYSKKNCGFLLGSFDGIDRDTYEIIYDEKSWYDMIGCEGEWFKIMFDDLDSRTSLIISVKQNDTGQERGGVLNINVGDWYGKIRITQKAE
ncbi:MAG: hypothetical protein K2G80_04190 [Bacteroidales bacterium]|nr:hypothetical protein [Bacteroidales bacterium]